MIPDQSLAKKPDKKLRKLRNISGHLVRHVAEHTVTALVLHHPIPAFFPVGILLCRDRKPDLYQNTLVLPFLPGNLLDIGKRQGIKPRVRGSGFDQFLQTRLLTIRQGVPLCYRVHNIQKQIIPEDESCIRPAAAPHQALFSPLSAILSRSSRTDRK